MTNKESGVVMSLGGSLIMPGCEVDSHYLINFADLLKIRILESKQRFAIVTGGGPLARMYQQALRDAGVTDAYELDRAGIRPTHQNALLLTDILNARGIQAQYTTRILTHLHDIPVWVTGGTKPGQSTDAPAVDWARILGYRQVINVSNTPFVYEYGPDGLINRTKPIFDLTHIDYLRLVGSVHEPGENVPAGRVGIQIAQQNAIDFIVVGPDIANLRRVLEDKPFVGTRIHP